MSERQKQIQFLKSLIDHEQTAECHVVREKIIRAEAEERCLKRMISLVLLLMFLSLATLCYATVFWPDFFRDRTDLLLKLPCSIGLASLICLIAFTGYWVWRRVLLNGLYNECRRLVMAAANARSGAPAETAR